MATRRTPYVYGSAAPNIEVMPRREDDYERRRQTRPVSRPRPKRKAKIDYFFCCNGCRHLLSAFAISVYLFE